MNKILRTIVSGAGAVLLFCVSSFAAPQYSVTDLGEPFAGNSYALGINNRGQVVGYWLSPAGARAFLRDGVRVIDLGNLGGTNDYALSLNAAGQVVGFSEWEWGTRAFMNDRGEMNVLETLGGTNTFAYGINDAGHIVGYVETPAGASAFLYRDAGDILYLSPVSYAFGINLSDQVVGTATTDITKPLRAFRWENGSVVDLTSELSRNPGWELTHARAINASGAIVGWGLRRGRERAYLLANGRVTDLGVLRRGTNSFAFGLNNSNHVVGATTLRDGSEQAFLWRNNRLIRLNDVIERNSGWELKEARGINDNGSIVGWGVFGGGQRAFLLTPFHLSSAQGNDNQPPVNPGIEVPSEQPLIFAASGGTTPVTNSPLADAHVRDGTFTNSNFGTNIVIELMKTNSTTANNRHAYFKFGIDNAPSPLGSAILRIWARTSASGSVTTRVYSVTDTNWTETGIKWTNKPALGTIQTNRSFSGTTLVSYDVDVTTYIRSEIAAGRGISTIALVSTNNTALLVSISSKETNTTANRPILILNTNTFPTVSISAPANNATFPTPTNLVISATASDTDGAVTNVDFYAGNFFIGRDGTSPFSYTWTNALVGVHGLKAVAYDNLGAVKTSAVVNVTLTKNLQPLADAHVKSDSVTVNFGTAIQLEVQTNNVTGPTRDTYFKFNLSGITNISNAKIRVFASVSAAGNGSGTYFSVADTNWTETGITWSNKPARSNVLGHIRPTSTTAAWITNDITSFVQGEKAAGREFISIVNHSQTNTTFFIRINSRETNANRPELVITTTNSSPAVSITTPANNAVFIAPANIPITASATDDGTVTQVEIFQGTTSLAVFTNAPYSLTWSNVTSGSYVLTARATDNFGLMKTSVVVNITVGVPPTVSVTNPAPASVFYAPASIEVGAAAADSDGTVAQVEFFAGTTSLGVDASSPYAVTWNSVPSGNYALTARATDNIGLITTSSVVNIVVDAPPSVTLTNPVNGAVFVAPADILLGADASDTDGTVAQVEFFAGTTSLGVDASAPFSVAWNGVTSGAYALTARATDNLGAVTTSAVVNIVVDVRPTVTVTNPVSGSLLAAPANILLQASATDADGTIAQVEFFEGTTSLGADTTNPYSLIWTNVVSGSYAITARVTDNHGLINTSAVVNVTVDAAPTVSVTSPANNTLFAPPANITLQASAADADGSVTNVEFFSGATKLGEDNSSPYSFAWNTVPTGSYSVTARATDNLGLTTVSTPVTLIVDTPPTVSITAPITGANFTLPTNIVVDATATDADGTVSRVNFYANDIWIGDDVSSPFSLTWSNATAGVTALTAVAVDDIGITSTSAVVTITNTFSPSALSGLRIWLDAGSGVTTNASAQISQWSDLSGNTNHATNVTSSQQPLWIAGTVNGRPVVRFDGTNDLLNLQRYTATNTFSVYVVTKASRSHEIDNEQFGMFNPNPGESGQRFLFGGVDSGIYGLSEVGISLGTNGVSGYEYERQQSTANFFNPMAVHAGPEAAAFSLIGLSYLNRQPSLSVNGALARAGLVSSRTNVVFTKTFGLGSSSQAFGGDVAEVLVFNRALNRDEEAQLTAYLNDKYQLFTTPVVSATLQAEGIAPGQIVVSWNQNTTNTIRSAILERREGVGSFVTLATVDGRRSYLDTNVSSSTTYAYRLRFRNLSGQEEYSNESAVTPPSSGLAIPVSNLKLWLQAGSGHETVNAGSWTDLTGGTNFATQLESTNRALVVNGALNGWPVLRFDGTNDQLLLQGYFASNDFTVLAVARTPASHEIDAESNAQGALGGSSGQRYLFGGQEPIDSSYSFGETALSVGTNGFSGYELAYNQIGNNHYAPLAVHQADMGTNMNLLSVVYSNHVPYLYRNTALVRAGLPSSRTNSMFTKNIGSGKAQGIRMSFMGDLAEIMVFDRQLTALEMGAISRHLNGKYSFATPENGSIALTARALSGTEVALSWRQADATALSSYIIERRAGISGAFVGVGQVSGDWRLVDTGLAPQTLYTYRVRNTLNSDPSAYSNEAQVQTLTNTTTFPYASAAIWLRAEDITVADGAAVATWPDYWLVTQSATQTNAASRPTFSTNGLNSLAAVQFGGGTFLELPSVLTNSTAAEIFVVLKSVTNAPAASQGLWKFNTNGASYYPSTGGAIQDSFGRTNAQALLGPLPDLRVASIYGVAAGTNVWRARLNGPVKQQVTSNTISFVETPLLGRSTPGASEPFAGHIAELIVFNRVLSLDEQKTVRDSLAQRYAITLELPHSPTNLTLIRTNSTDYHLSWSALTGSENGLESSFVVERQSDTNTPFLSRALLSRTDSAYSDSPDLVEVNYGYRLRMINDVGETVSQTLTASMTDTDGDGVPDYLETILGTNPNNADTDGDGLPDGWELKYGLNPRSASGRDGAAGDFDNDGISNLDEFQQGGDPANGATGDNPSIRLRIHRPN